jgi:hypothetical protein
MRKPSSIWNTPVSKMDIFVTGVQRSLWNQRAQTVRLSKALREVGQASSMDLTFVAHGEEKVSKKFRDPISSRRSVLKELWPAQV